MTWVDGAWFTVAIFLAVFVLVLSVRCLMIGWEDLKAIVHGDPDE